MRLLLMLLAVVVLAGCTAAPAGAPTLEGLPRMTVSTSAYAQGASIPGTYTCMGDNVSPPLSFSDVPAEARYLVGLLEDPDASRGTWTHWTWWDVPANVTSLAQDVDIAALGGHEGTTTGKTVGYAGPCPKVGEHHYHLLVYATTEPLGLPDGASVSEVHLAIAQKAIAQGEWMGLYENP